MGLENYIGADVTRQAKQKKHVYTQSDHASKTQPICFSMDWKSLVCNIPVCVWLVGVRSLPCARLHANWLDRCGKGDLLPLFVLLPPTTRTFLLFVRREDHVFVE